MTTTPEPPGEPTPPSFEKPAAGGSGGGSPYDNPPQYPTAPPVNQDPYGTPPPPYGGLPPYGAGAGTAAGTAAGPGAADMPPLGGLGERFVARVIDWVILLVVGGAIASIVVLGSNIDNYYIVTVTVLFAGLIGLVYEALMLNRAGGQTVGKKVMRIRVAMLADGSAPTGAASWMRAGVFWVPAILSGFCLPALFSLVDILWCTWDRPYRQCLHDKAARTVVVRAT
ncbi:RDD family protein [Streptacidiphilus cavernicola]|uniref:RDD family protein n=1 Tax=Streptacidiphilus cavernicola TaxID=3342716 RepID=A0ABV6W097_9ACTN